MIIDRVTIQSSIKATHMMHASSSILRHHLELPATDLTESVARSSHQKLLEECESMNYRANCIIIISYISSIERVASQLL